jgi:hypothetical protein
VIDAGTKGNLWRLEWIFGRKMNIEKENTAFINGSRRTQNGRYPLVNIVAFWPSTGKKQHDVVVVRNCSALSDLEVARGKSYLQFGGGSRVISANSFWILLAEVERAFDPMVLEVRSLALLSRSRSAAAAAAVAEEALDVEDISVGAVGLVFNKNKTIDRSIGESLKP